MLRSGKTYRTRDSREVSIGVTDSLKAYGKVASKDGTFSSTWYRNGRNVVDNMLDVVFHIDAGDFITIGGHKAQVICQMPESQDNWLGVVKVSDYWIPTVWTKDGINRIYDYNICINKSKSDCMIFGRDGALCLGYSEPPQGGFKLDFEYDRNGFIDRSTLRIVY